MLKVVGVTRDAGRAGSSLSRLRATNRKLVFDAITAAPPISRAELSQELGLSPTAVGAIVGELLRGELVREREGVSGGGRPPTLLEVHSDTATVLGLEMSPDRLRAVVSDPGGRVVATRARPLAMDEGPDRLVADCLAVAGDAVAAAASAAPRPPRLLAIGVACSGVVARDGSISSPDMPGASNVGIPLGAALREAFDVPIMLDNDANLGALAEVRFGAGRGLQDVVYVLAHAGLGAGLVLDGRLYGGWHNSAGEIGHTVVDPGGRLCQCGNYGCLETLVSSSALVEHAREGLRLGRPSELPREPGAIDAKRVIEAAANADIAATHAVEAVAEHLGLGVANLANLFSPQAIVLGGPLAALGGTVIAPLASVARQRSLEALRDEVAIIASPLGEEGPVLGACAAAMDLWLTLADELSPTDAGSRPADPTTNED